MPRTHTEVKSRRVVKLAEPVHYHASRLRGIAVLEAIVASAASGKPVQIV
jgi:hypothetical protein